VRSRIGPKRKCGDLEGTRLTVLLINHSFDKRIGARVVGPKMISGSIALRCTDRARRKSLECCRLVHPHIPHRSNVLCPILSTLGPTYFRRPISPARSIGTGSTAQGTHLLSIYPHSCGPAANHTKFARSRGADIDNAPATIRAAIVYPHGYRTPVAYVGH
jgi:hypothetical protein